MAPAFRRGDENRPQRWILASSRVNGTAVPGSLSEGVSFVGCFGPLVYHAAPLALKFLSGCVHRGTLPQSASLPAPSGREPGTVAGGAYHSMCRSETGRLRAIFIAPTKLRGGYILPFNRVLAKPQGFGRFSSPLRKAFAVHWGVLSRVNWYFIISVWRSRCMTPSAILRMSRDATKARVFSASSRGTL